MSLAASDRRNDYVGNGNVSTYSFDFKILDESHLSVIVRDTSDVETVLVLDTDYTVDGVGSASGGSVSLIDAAQSWYESPNGLKDNYVITIKGATPKTQTTDIRNQGPYYPSLHEDTFDKIVMMAQEMQNDLDGAVKLPSTIDPAVFDPTLPTDTTDAANKILSVNPGGTALQWKSSSDILGADVAAAEAAATAAEAAAVAAEAAADIASAASASFFPSPTDLLNLGLAYISGAGAGTIRLTQSDGSSDPSVAGPVKISFRGANSSGGFNSRTVNSARSLTISSGSTLGLRASFPQKIYVYAIDNAGTVELAVSSALFKDNKLVSTTAEGGAGAADSGALMYSTTARSNVACRLIGSIDVTPSVAGTWGAISKISLVSYETAAQEPVIAIAAGANPSGTLAASYNNMIIGNKTQDTKNIYDISNGTFTLKADGYYEAYASTRVDHATTTVTGIFSGQWVLNSTAIPGSVFIDCFRATGVTEPVMITSRCTFSGVVGQTLNFQVYTEGGTPAYGNNSGGVHSMVVRKIGELID